MATTQSQIILTPEARIHFVRTHPRDIKNDSIPRPTLVFLHFWGGSSKTWKPLISLLSATYPTIAIDFRGWGASSGPADPEAYSVSHLADDVIAVVQVANIDEYILIGHSMGAKVAQLLASRPMPKLSSEQKNKKLKAMVLVCPAPPTPLVMPEEMRDQQVHAYDTAERAEFVVRNVLTASELDTGMIDSLVEDMLKGNELARAAWPSYAMAEDFSVVGVKTEVPSLVIAAERDVVEPLASITKEVVNRMGTVEVVVIQRSGHLAPVEAPGQLADTILKFLDHITS